MKFSEKLQDTFSIVFQIGSMLPMIVLDTLYKPKIDKPKDLFIKPGTLVISNHQTSMDPWAVTWYLGVSNFLKIMPVKYPVTPRFFRKPVVGQLIWLFGGFDIGATPFEKAGKLHYIRDLLNRRYTILLFPEGKRIQDERSRLIFQRGIHALLQENPPILLVRLRGMKSSSILKLWKNDISIRYSPLIEHGSFEDKVKLIEDFFELT